MEIMRNAECRMQNEQNGSGFGDQGSEKTGHRAVGNGQWALGRPEDIQERETASGFIHHSSFIIHNSSLIPHPSRRGISLMEVLISIFVLSVGLLGVAAIIPLGQLALWETAKADRCGACGRAALREIQVSRLLDFRYWYWTPNKSPNLPNPGFAGNYWGCYPPFKTANTIPDDFATVSSCSDSMPFVIDPLGRAKGLPEVFGPASLPKFSIFLPRRTLRILPLAASSTYSQPPQQTINPDLFYWSDDLPFDIVKNSVARPTLVKTSTGVVTTSLGDYSWFFTVMPVASESRINYATTPPTVVPLPVASRRLFNVSVAVCYKRNFQITYDPNNIYPNSPTTNTLDGEHTATINLNTGFLGMGIGGGTVQLNSSVNVKENQWVMLYYLYLDPNTGDPLSSSGYPQMSRCCWYRVVGVGGANTLSLSGPDWDLCGSAWNPSPGKPPAQAVLVVVPNVIGVYNTTMELDWDPLWTK
jgi:hypothetical protein